MPPHPRRTRRAARPAGSCGSAAGAPEPPARVECSPAEARREALSSCLVRRAAIRRGFVRPGHEQADPLAVDLARRICRRKLPARDHGDAVRDLEDLVQILADDEHRGTALGHVRQHLANERRRPCVHAPGWLVDHQDSGLPVELASDHELLEIPAGERLRRRVGPARAHVEPFHDAVRHREGPGLVDEAGAYQAAPGRVAGEQHVVRKHEGRHRAVPEPLLGHERGTEPPARGDAAGAAGLSGDGDRVRHRREPLARQRIEELGLSVARHPRDRHHFARPHFERHVAQRHPERTVGRQRQRRGGEHRRAVASVRLGAHRVHVRAHHQSRQRGRGLGLRVDVRDHLAVAQDGGVVTELLHLLEPVRDVEHRAAVAGEPAQRHEELVRLLRGEHRGRLVHDQQPRLLQQATHDLDALALAHREIRDQRGRLQRQPELRRHPRDALAERPEIEPPGQGERDVLGHGERLEQREVLEHHADPEPPGRRRVRDVDRLAAPPELPVGGLERAVDDLDERRLAGAVLAEQRVDLAGRQAQRHPVVRGEVAEALDDVECLEEIPAAGTCRPVHRDAPAAAPGAGTANVDRPGSTRLRAVRASPVRAFRTSASDLFTAPLRPRLRAPGLPKWRGLHPAPGAAPRRRRRSRPGASSRW